MAGSIKLWIIRWLSCLPFIIPKVENMQNMVSSQYFHRLKLEPCLVVFDSVFPSSFLHSTRRKFYQAPMPPFVLHEVHEVSLYSSCERREFNNADMPWYNLPQPPSTINIEKPSGRWLLYAMGIICATETLRYNAWFGILSQVWCCLLGGWQWCSMPRVFFHLLLFVQRTTSCGEGVCWSRREN